MNNEIKKALPTKEQIKKAHPQLKEKDLELLIHISQRTGLDILRKQLWVVTRKDKDGNPIVTIQTGIDGFRCVAERTGKYAPGKESLIILDDNGNIISATAYVKKMTDDGTWHEVASTAFFEEFVQTYCDKITKTNKPTKFWLEKPKLMLAKCAESLALRRAFPDALSGIYTKEEMDQADENNEMEFISEAQLNLLMSFINKSSDPEETIKYYCNALKINSLDEIPKEKFQSIIDTLKRKVNGGTQ